MKATELLTLSVLMVLGAPAGFAADSPDLTKQPPATRPAAPDILGLITKLGAEDFKTREAASDELRKIGQPAMPNLKEAAKSSDPEVQARAQSLIKDIENASKPKVNDDGIADADLFRGNGNANGQVRIFINGQAVDVGNGRNVRMSKTVTVVNNRKEIDVTENQRKVHITEDADGIKMSVTETVDGKETTTKYEAKNAAELKENQPEAYKIYEKNTQPEPVGRPRVIRPRHGGVIVPRPNNPDDIRIELPPEVLRELPPEMQQEFGPREDKTAEKPATRPAKAE